MNRTHVQLVRPLIGFDALSDFVVVRHDHAVFDLRDDADPTTVDLREPRLPQWAATYELVSLQVPDLRFLAAEGAGLFAHYAPDLAECAPLSLPRELGLDRWDEALVLVLLSRDSDSAWMTANLAAPVVVNVRRRLAAQVILTGVDWPVRAAVV